MALKPLKRFVELQDFSRTHHEALMISFKLRIGLKENISSERLVNYLVWCVNEVLSPHFIIEENNLFKVLHSDDEMVKKAISEHQEIISKISNLNFKKYTCNEEISTIEKLIVNNIRFEERKLYERIQVEVPLEKLKEIHLSIKSETSRSCPYYRDEFWIKKKSI